MINDERLKHCPFEAWQLIQTREILQWLTEGKAMSLDKQSFLERIEDTLFNVAYDKLGLKPISKCSVGGTCWRYCIPFDANEHLLGETDDCDEYYKTWLEK